MSYTKRWIQLSNEKKQLKMETGLEIENDWKDEFTLARFIFWPIMTAYIIFTNPSLAHLDSGIRRNDEVDDTYPS